MTQWEKDNVIDYDFFLFDTEVIDPTFIDPLKEDQGEYAGTTVKVTSFIVEQQKEEMKRPTTEFQDMPVRKEQEGLPRENMDKSPRQPEGDRRSVGVPPQDIEGIPLPEDMEMPDGNEEDLPPQFLEGIPLSNTEGPSPRPGGEMMTDGKDQADSKILKDRRDIPMLKDFANE